MRSEQHQRIRRQDLPVGTAKFPIGADAFRRYLDSRGSCRSSVATDVIIWTAFRGADTGGGTHLGGVPWGTAGAWIPQIGADECCFVAQFDCRDSRDVLPVACPDIIQVWMSPFDSDAHYTGDLADAYCVVGLEACDIAKPIVGARPFVARQDGALIRELDCLEDGGDGDFPGVISLASKIGGVGVDREELKSPVETCPNGHRLVAQLCSWNPFVLGPPEDPAGAWLDVPESLSSSVNVPMLDGGRLLIFCAERDGSLVPRFVYS